MTAGAALTATSLTTAAIIAGDYQKSTDISTILPNLLLENLGNKMNLLSLEGRLCLLIILVDKLGMRKAVPLLNSGVP